MGLIPSKQNAGSWHTSPRIGTLRETVLNRQGGTREVFMPQPPLFWPLVATFAIHYIKANSIPAVFQAGFLVF